jgi:hypothetical protein
LVTCGQKWLAHLTPFFSAREREQAGCLAPVRYLAALLGADSETALRWFVLVVALLLDPAAVLLFCWPRRRDGILDRGPLRRRAMTGGGAGLPS